MVVFDELHVRDTIPLDFPVPEGVKLTARVTYWPGSSVIPCPIPDVMKPVPETAFCWSVRELVPVLASVAPRVAVVPVATSPKSTLELYIVRTGTACGAVGMEGIEFPPPPPQPVADSPPARRAMCNHWRIFSAVLFLKGYTSNDCSQLTPAQ
jgi:hypothetical protein